MSFINGQSIIIGILWTMTELYNMFSGSILQFYHCQYEYKYRVNFKLYKAGRHTNFGARFI